MMRTVRRSRQTKGGETNGMGKGTKCNSGRARGIKRKSSKSGTSTRDMVIRCEEKIESLIVQFSNHSKRHWAIEVVIITAIIGYVITLIQKI